jgi:hypothetical protein
MTMIKGPQWENKIGQGRKRVFFFHVEYYKTN